MAKRYAKKSSFSFPLGSLVAVLQDPGFQVAREKNNGAVDAKVIEVERSPSRAVWEVHTTEYAKGLAGVDKSKTESAVSRYEFDLDKLSCTWTYKGAHAEKVRVWGSIEVRGDDERCDMDAEFNVEVKVPLIGGKIEGVVIAESEKVWPSYERLIEEWAAKLGA